MTKQLLCPNDQAPLTVQTRFEIEVDICPTCQGMWLDKDELNKILRVSRGERPQKNSFGDTVVGVAPVLPSPGSSSKSDALAGVADFFGGFFS